MGFAPNARLQAAKTCRELVRAANQVVEARRVLGFPNRDGGRRATRLGKRERAQIDAALNSAVGALMQAHRALAQHATDPACPPSPAPPAE